MREEIANNILMSESTSLLLKAVAGIITGILVASGHLDVTNQDSFSQVIQTGAGAIVTIISAFYILEHAYQSAKAELEHSDWKDTSKTTTVTAEPVSTPTQPMQ